MKLKVMTWLCGFAIAVSTLGCSSPSKISDSGSKKTQYNNRNAPFVNQLDRDKVEPITAYNPTQSDSDLYTHLLVFSESGEKTVLDVRRYPIFFEAYWCPHCQRTLVLWKQNTGEIPQLPIIVSLGFQPGTTLPEAVKLSHEESQALGLTGFTTYYMLGSVKQLVPRGIPSLIFERDGKTEMLVGEHTMSVWKTALGQPIK